MYREGNPRADNRSSALRDGSGQRVRPTVRIPRGSFRRVFVLVQASLAAMSRMEMDVPLSGSLSTLLVVRVVRCFRLW